MAPKSEMATGGSEIRILFLKKTNKNNPIFLLETFLVWNGDGVFLLPPAPLRMFVDSSHRISRIASQGTRFKETGEGENW